MINQIIPQHASEHNLKTCTKCGEAKPVTAFSKHADKRDGLQSHCKDCASEHNRFYREANREQLTDYQRAWREANPDKKRAAAHAWLEANRERSREIARAWSKANPDKVRAKEANRRARERGAEGYHTAADMRVVQAGQTNKRGEVCCWWCNKPMTKWHEDHRIALANGGSNWPNNMCLACADCNLSKHTKTPAEFAGRLL